VADCTTTILLSSHRGHQTVLAKEKKKERERERKKEKKV
jgi:hypothetical protein